MILIYQNMYEETSTSTNRPLKLCSRIVSEWTGVISSWLIFVWHSLLDVPLYFSLSISFLSFLSSISLISRTSLTLCSSLCSKHCKSLLFLASLFLWDADLSTPGCCSFDLIFSWDCSVWAKNQWCMSLSMRHAVTRTMITWYTSVTPVSSSCWVSDCNCWEIRLLVVIGSNSSVAVGCCYQVRVICSNDDTSHFNTHIQQHTSARHFFLF